MTKIHLHSFASQIRSVLPICAALLVSSCSLLRPSPTETSSLPQIAPPAPHLAQMNFGRQAEFGLCTPPVCPAVTSKTLAPPLPHAALPAPQLPTVVSTLDARVEIVPAPPRTRTVTLHFRFGDASLGAADKFALDSSVATAPDANHIVISGRTDSIGSASANELLATARARSVDDYLRTRHPHLAPVLRLDAQGSCCYVAANDTEQGRSLNRRVDVLFSGNGRQQP